MPPRIPDLPALARVLDRLPGWDFVVLHGGKTLKGDILTREFQLTDGRQTSRKETKQIEVHAPRSWLLGWFQSLRLSWTSLDGVRHNGKIAAGQRVVVRLAGRKEDASCFLENVQSVRFGFHDESFYDAPKPPLESYRPEAVYEGVVTGLEQYGVFVDVDGHRTGLLHISKLRAKSRDLRELKAKDVISVHVLRAYLENGKERLELDLARDYSPPSTGG